VGRSVLPHIQAPAGQLLGRLKAYFEGVLTNRLLEILLRLANRLEFEVGDLLKAN
jgi:hypothetical protein